MDLKYLLCDPPVSVFALKANKTAADAALMKEQHHLHRHQFNYMMDWHANSTTSPIYPPTQPEITTLLHQQQQQEWNSIHISSPKSICSSISTCSSTSSTNSTDNNNIAASASSLFPPGRSLSLTSPPPLPPTMISPRSTTLSKQYHHQQQQRRRAASDVSLTRHHMFIYSHPNHRSRPRSESAGGGSSHNNNNNNSATTVQTRTPWTPSEDHLLQEGYDQGLSWAMISSTYLPHRSRGCCWGRFKTLQNKNMVDSSHSHMRHFKRPWKAVDFNNNSSNNGVGRGGEKKCCGSALL